jgi:hypothetical protein
MIRTRFFKNNSGLRAGDWVEVRSAEEILDTLDDEGRLDALPFMPEMLQYCGKRFRVFKSAHKTCDTIKTHHNRRMTKAVHLEGLRCDGEAHGGCQAGCLLFFKEVWLKRVRDRESKETPAKTASETRRAVGSGGSRCDVEALVCATRVLVIEGEAAAERYRCQATEMFEATTPFEWWDPRQYVKDLVSRNVRPLDFIRYVAIAAFNVVMRLHWRLRPYPYICGLADGKTPAELLNLQPGELVEIRSKDEIMRTLNNGGNRNRGLSFDVEMVPYCGKIFRVLRRIERIVNDKTGKMIRLPTACIILDGVTCSGCLSMNRLFCPRSIYPYWHEIWLKRVDKAESRSRDFTQRAGLGACDYGPPSNSGDSVCSGESSLLHGRGRLAKLARCLPHWLAMRLL